LLEIEQVRDDDVGAKLVELSAALVVTVHDRSYALAGFKELPGYGISGLTGRAGNENRMHCGNPHILKHQ
jgi:hypothetical protein